MNNVILNGKKSELVNGLLIQSLPPISKPLMRAMLEEVDGRDGDIITKLGYSAYDKEMVIGLHGDYDVDDVIQYFDSDGIVIFSNESDKYYRYSILQQIDFERLIRYKVAVVTFHVQPFKYSTIEKAITFAITGNTQSVTVRNSGNIQSRPTLTIYGSGTINLSLNGYQIFAIDLGNEEYITINMEQMEASKDGILKNRLVSGDYDNFFLDIGQNTISWSGTVTSIAVENYSRWI